jgi:hypothetical protein
MLGSCVVILVRSLIRNVDNKDVYNHITFGMRVFTSACNIQICTQVIGISNMVSKSPTPERLLIGFAAMDLENSPPFHVRFVRESTKDAVGVALS